MSEETKDLSNLAKMRDPFPDHQISQMCRPTNKDNPKARCPKCGGYHGLPAIQLSYVGHAALTDRLLDTDPTWTWEPLSLDAQGYPALDKDGGMWIKLTVCGVTRLGYGDAQGKTGGNAMKERIGDALRNAAMRFGAALELWHKGDLHLDDDEGDKPTQTNKEETISITGLTDNDMEDVTIAMNEASELEVLRSVFGAAWRKATREQRTILESLYNSLKTKLS